MMKTRAFPNAKLLSIATLLTVGYLAGDAIAQPRFAPAPAPARPPTAAPAPHAAAPKSVVGSGVAANKSAGQFNHVIGYDYPHRQNLPTGTIVTPPVINVSFWDSNNSSVGAPATRALVAINDTKIGVQNLPALGPGTAVQKFGDFGTFVWEWASPQRFWSILTPEMACRRLEPRPQKFAAGVSSSPNNTAQYHSGCIVNVKIWIDVPEKIPCTPVGTLCIELLPTTTPALAADIEILDDVSQFPPCDTGTKAPTCTSPGFGWPAHP